MGQDSFYIFNIPLELTKKTRKYHIVLIEGTLSRVWPEENGAETLSECDRARSNFAGALGGKRFCSRTC